MRHSVHRGVIIALALLVARAGHAQTVRGQIVDRASGQPAPGVVVLLLADGDRAVAQGFTDARGEYRLTAGSGGTFRVRTLRIGYRPATSPVFTLAAGGEIELAPLHAGTPVTLDTVRIVGRNSCRAVTGGAATFALWEQARTALTAAQITAHARVMSARIVTYRRALDPARGHVRSHEAALRSGFTSRPWHSLPADSLRRVGYVVLDRQNWLNYYAPDLDVLLSAEFLADHCFRIAPESDRSRVGIAFEPTRERRDLPEIRGTLWLDRASSELRRLDFTYDNIDPALMDAGAGGSVEFARLANGAWVVSRWTIRMPVVERRNESAGFRSRARVVRTQLTEVREEGGVLGLVMRGQDTLWAAPPLAIAGRVLDSATNAGVAHARLALRGTGLETMSDSAGRFRMSEVLPGRYQMDVRSPAMDAFGALQTVPVTVTDTVVSMTVHVPGADRLSARACPGNAGGVVVGTVWRADSAAAGRARVVAEFRERRIEGNVVQERPRWLTATADIRGKYRICGAPVDNPMLVSAESDSGNSAPVELRIPPGQRVLPQDLLIDRRGARNAVLTGVVMSDVDGAPLPDVQVLLPSVPRNAFTDANGAFRLSNIPPGTHAVQVRKLGYRQLDLRVDFAASQTVERRLLLSRVVMLDTVTASARALLPSFEEHRRVGLGHFWTREDLAVQEGRRLSEVLDQTAALTVVRARGNAAWIAAGRGVRGGIGGGTTTCSDWTLDGGGPADTTKSCACYAQVWIDNIPLFLGRPGEEVPNVNRIPVSAIEAIEFYGSPAQIPAKYSGLNTHCGVLVIHTRKTLDP